MKEISKLILNRFRKLPPHAYPEQFSSELDYPNSEWPCRFIMIASTPRCGSHYLGHMLADTGLLGRPLEYLHPGSLRYWQKRFPARNLGILFKYLVQHRTSPNGIFSFKAHWDHFKPYSAQIRELTKGVGIDKVLFIYRRDQLSQAVSHSIASQTGVWISGALPSRIAHYSYDDILRKANNTRQDNLAWKQYLSKAYDGHYLSVPYEDLLLESEHWSMTLSSFLGIRLSLSTPSRAKVQRSGLNKDWQERFRFEVKPQDSWILEDPDWL